MTSRETLKLGIARMSIVFVSEDCILLRPKSPNLPVFSRT